MRHAFAQFFSREATSFEMPHITVIRSMYEYTYSRGNTRVVHVTVSLSSHGRTSLYAVICAQNLNFVCPEPSETKSLTPICNNVHNFDTKKKSIENQLISAIFAHPSPLFKSFCTFL